MNLIQNVTSDALQQQSIILPNGSTLTFTLYFRPIQQGWFFNNITNGTFVVNGLRVTNNPNMLNQWRNLIIFGLACFSTTTREPSQQQDFSSGASNLYLLTQADVAAYTEYLQLG